MAYSDDLLHWHEPLDGPVLLPRQSNGDSKGVEPGPPPLMLAQGTQGSILLVYCGWGEDRTYRPGWVLFSKEEPERVLARSEEPILEPAKNWGERFGLTNHVVADMRRYEGRWWLYYAPPTKPSAWRAGD